MLAPTDYEITEVESGEGALAATCGSSLGVREEPLHVHPPVCDELGALSLALLRERPRPDVRKSGQCAFREPQHRQPPKFASRRSRKEATPSLTSSLPI